MRACDVWREGVVTAVDGQVVGGEGAAGAGDEEGSGKFTVDLMDQFFRDPNMQQVWGGACMRVPIVLQSARMLNFLLFSLIMSLLGDGSGTAGARIMVSKRLLQEAVGH
jgi:hypothetical protein